MYSGTTFTRASGRLLGAHQKIDRLAAEQLQSLINPNRFPPISSVLKFEGKNGPDAIKRKSPAKDEPWHYFQPFDSNDRQLIDLINSHYSELVKALKLNDEVKAAFEAAWLSHAVVDGLTPAHHYPYEQKLIELRGGQGIESRRSIKEKLMMPGLNTAERIKNNWKFWGPKGLFMTHMAFEMGIATMLRPIKYSSCLITKKECQTLSSKNISSWYRSVAQEIAKLDIYNKFYAHGWTRDLANEVKDELIPVIVKSVALIWYSAVNEAGTV